MIELDSTLDPSEGLALFTDGSAYWKDGSGGWAFAVLDAFDGLYRESGWSKNTTNNQMELMGPTYGLNWIFTYVGPSEILVYSDSEYVVLGVQDPSRSRNKNLTFWETLDKAIEMHPYVEFIHVKGHEDHFWNEMVDDMAGKARKEGLRDQS